MDRVAAHASARHPGGGLQRTPRPPAAGRAHAQESEWQGLELRLTRMAEKQPRLRGPPDPRVGVRLAAPGMPAADSLPACRRPLGIGWRVTAARPAFGKDSYSLAARLCWLLMERSGREAPPFCARCVWSGSRAGRGGGAAGGAGRSLGFRFSAVLAFFVAQSSLWAAAGRASRDMQWPDLCRLLEAELRLGVGVRPEVCPSCWGRGRSREEPGRKAGSRTRGLDLAPHYKVVK